VAGSEASAILIEGESGTGKEVIARVLHSLSERHGRPFVPVTCSAIPDNLIESELFGHEEGAFHGALAPKTGLFEIASGGTLFLDEIRDLSPAIQAKILRVVEERSFRRLGSLENIAVDLRVIAATNHRNGQSDDFGTDLFRRAEVVRLGLPSLRERHDDILPLARHFIAQSHSRQTPPVEGISADAAKLLLEHPWPGNVRELRNVIERAVRAEASRQLSPSSIHFVEMPAKKPGTDGDDSPTESERSLVLRALEKSGGNQTRSAKLLGITRDMLRYRMKKMRLRSGTVLDMDATP
jgi:transcriptional regulator with PAS, ATPase and Fis domain